MKAPVKYLVTQRPLRRYAGHLVTIAIVVDAKSAAEAVSAAIEAGDPSGENWFGGNPQYSNPKAEPLALGKVYRF